MRKQNKTFDWLFLSLSLYHSCRAITYRRTFVKLGTYPRGKQLRPRTAAQEQSMITVHVQNDQQGNEAQSNQTRPTHPSVQPSNSARGIQTNQHIKMQPFGWHEKSPPCRTPFASSRTGPLTHPWAAPRQHHRALVSGGDLLDRNDLVRVEIHLLQEGVHLKQKSGDRMSTQDSC